MQTDIRMKRNLFDPTFSYKHFANQISMQFLLYFSSLLKCLRAANRSTANI